MRLTPAQPRRVAIDGMLPVMNVVLLLMVFLLLTGQFAKGGGTGSAATQRPHSDRAAAGVAAAVSLRLDRDGRLWAGAQALEAQNWSGWLAAQPTGLQARGLVLDADAEAPAPAVIAVLARLRAAGFLRIHLRAVRRP